MIKILNHPIVNITDENGQYVLRLRMNNGSYVKCNPYERNLKGLVAAMTVAIDALSGKIWIDGVDEKKAETTKNEVKQIEIETKLIS